jgi:hypothetical protein
MPKESATHTWLEVTNGVALATGQHHRIVVPSQELIVRFQIDPTCEAELEQETFTLLGGQDKDAPVYRQSKTGKDDLIKGDEYLDLLFTDLVPNVKYWLEVDPGNSQPKYMAFSAVPWDQIRQW